jgi:iron complex outermembrane receptor protein
MRLLSSIYEIIKKLVMRFNQFILGVLFTIVGSAFINTQTIERSMTDEKGQALSYSNVVDKVTRQGVTTDGNSDFVSTLKRISSYADC